LPVKGTRNRVAELRRKETAARGDGGARPRIVGARTAFKTDNPVLLRYARRRTPLCVPERCIDRLVEQVRFAPVPHARAQKTEIRGGLRPAASGRDPGILVVCAGRRIGS